ncbi:hypothetical protein BH18THE2_BH18THE2_10020 [soil metagenome]
MYALAQLGQGSGNTDKEASGVGPVANLTSSKTSIPSTNETIYLNYTSSNNGFKIKYPSNWIIVLPEGFEGSNNEITSNNSSHQVVAKFSSPNHDNLTISIDSLGEQPVNVKQYIDNAVNSSRDAFAEFHVLDLRVSSAASANSTMKGNNYAFNATSSPVIYNLTYTAEEDDHAPIMGMDVGAIFNKTAYVISYRSTPESYATYLPVVTEMIYSFEIIDLNKFATPESSSSGATNSSPLRTSSNASTVSKEQNTVIESENGNSSPNSPASNTIPSTASQQPNPNYYPSVPSASTGSAYPTTQPYPSGSLYPEGYSPYPEGYSPYAGYSPYVVTDPVYPTTPIYPPNEYTNPTILSYNTYNDTAGVFHIVGEVENSSPSLITSVQVIAAFYNNLNQLLAIKYAYTNPPSIPSSQLAFYDLTIPPGTIPVDSVSQWTLRLVWQ